MHSLLLLCCCITSAFAYDVFNSNCTVPEHVVNYSSGPNTRGTLDIVWTSLATIIACVYTVLHLNIPEPRQSDGKGWRGDPGWRGELYWGIKDTFRTLSYAMITAFVPELMASKAINDLIEARRNLKKIHEACPESKGLWTLQHMLYADMGGFYVEYGAAVGHPDTSPGMELRAISPGVVPQRELENCGMATEHLRSVSHDTRSRSASTAAGSEQAHDDNGTASTSNTESSKSRNNSKLRHYFTGADLVSAIKDGTISSVPALTRQEIEDKSKADLFGKLVAIFQISYFVLSTIVRAVQHLAVSPLELGACAFVPYAIVMYVVTNSKPKGARVSTRICTYDGDLPAAMDPDHVGPWPGRELFGIYLLGYGRSAFHKPFPTYTTSEARQSETFLCVIFLSIPFGAIHLAAWNFSFPTYVDAQSWRTAAILITVGLVAPISIIGIAIWILEIMSDDFVSEGPLVWTLLISVIAYPVARAVVLIETFRTLAYLPPSSYVATWAAGLPHVG